MAAVTLWIGNLPGGVTRDELFWMVVHRFGLLPGEFENLRLYAAKEGYKTSSCHLVVLNDVAVNKVLKWNGHKLFEVADTPMLDIRLARDKVVRTQATSHSFMYVCDFFGRLCWTTFCLTTFLNDFCGRRFWTIVCTICWKTLLDDFV